MTLTDTQELLEQVKACTTAEAVSDIIAEYGEDCTAEEAAVIFRQRHADHGFLCGDSSAVLCGKTIACPHCKNTSPDSQLDRTALRQSCNPFRLLLLRNTIHSLKRKPCGA